MSRLPIFILLIFCFGSPFLLAQNGGPEPPVFPKKEPRFLSLEPAPAFDKKRFWLSAGTGTAVYSGISIALWNSWYRDFPLTKFHTFNDMPEWLGMDKTGHFFSTWMEANFVSHGARWTGIENKKAMWTGVGVGIGIQTTIEIMDGFSEEWGFSWSDMAFNALGAAAFATQEMAWKEQRIIFKVSGTRPDYPTEPIFSNDGGQQATLKDRAAELYGTSAYEVILKDYNALSTWASVNIHSFLPEAKNSRFPKWLNLAVGIGANNIYGGFENKWETEDGIFFSLDHATYPRFHQFFFSPDIDLTRIPTRKRWLKLTLGVLNVFKFPAPAFELNTLGKAHFHAFYW